ncbi:hypothetical protein GQ53DRAFT_162394 [Thozetella sp. PMI_491]|nr:hypothetical protein GQ53DRAFT_162394 [Thozetella sp. PMI_491]
MAKVGSYGINNHPRTTLDRRAREDGRSPGSSRIFIRPAFPWFRLRPAPTRAISAATASSLMALRVLKNRLDLEPKWILQVGANRRDSSHKTPGVLCKWFGELDRKENTEAPQALHSTSLQANVACVDSRNRLRSSKTQPMAVIGIGKPRRRCPFPRPS